MKIIVAVAQNGAIGKNGELLFHISPDLKRFKQLTMGHEIIMGRKTFMSLPGGALPGRKNIVLTRNPDFHAEGAEILYDADSVLKSCNDDAFVIGGEEIYKLMLPYSDTVYLTEIDAECPDADAFFPELPDGIWSTVECGPWLTDEKRDVRYRFRTLKRNNPLS